MSSSLPPDPQDRLSRSTIEEHQPSADERLELVARVLDLLPDFFYVHDYDMRFIYSNQKAAEYFGVESKEHLIGRRLTDVDRDPEQARFFVELCQRIMRDGVPQVSDNLPYRRSDGTTGLLRQHDIPFVNPKTGARMLLGLSRDVTAERDLERQRVRTAELERELEIARQIQRGLRPTERPDVGAELDLAAHCEPAAYAGGDFYDWFMTRDGRVAVVIGDVTGHGVGPALLASECRAYARVLLASEPLERAFRELDGLLQADLGAGRFITFAAALIDPDTFAAEVLSAGHGPILGLAGGQLGTLPVQRPPLGISIDGESEPAVSMSLRPGDALVLVSDGLLEARGVDGTQYGVARASREITEHARRGGEGLVDALTRGLREHVRSTPVADDVTVVYAGRAAR